MKTQEKAFRINQHLSLKQKNDETMIYVAGERFRSCKYLLLEIPRENTDDYERFESIDDAMDYYNHANERPISNRRSLDPETEFWGHCSNLQAWAEHDYDTRFLDMRLAFPLLKALTDAGDPVARRVFKEEIANRMNGNTESVKTYLKEKGYLDYLTKEEMEAFVKEWVKYNGDWIPVIDHTLSLKEQGIEELSDVKGLCDLKTVEILNLRGNQISEIPKFIENLKSLKILNLSENKLRTVPKVLTKCTPLKNLILMDNLITEIPESIDNLKFLKALGLSKNKLKKIPKFIGNIPSLEFLYISENQLKTLPDSIGNLRFLKVLLLQKNKLEELPESLGNLSLLEDLSLYENCLMSIPKSIGKLRSLKKLELWDNQLQILPKTIGDLISLEELNLEKNKLTEIPESIGNLKKLRELDVRENNLENIPETITNIKSLIAFRIKANPSLTLSKPMKNFLENLKRKKRVLFKY